MKNDSEKLSLSVETNMYAIFKTLILFFHSFSEIFSSIFINIFINFLSWSINFPCVIYSQVTSPFKNMSNRQTLTINSGINVEIYVIAGSLMRTLKKKQFLFVLKYTAQNN